MRNSCPYICEFISVPCSIPQTHLPILTSIPNYLYNCSSTITWNQIVSSPTMFSFSKLLLAIAVLLSHQVFRWSIKTISHKPLFTYSDNAIRGKKKKKEVLDHQFPSSPTEQHEMRVKQMHVDGGMASLLRSPVRSENHYCV